MDRGIARTAITRARSGGRIMDLQLKELDLLLEGLHL